MQAFLNDPKIKTKYLKRVRAHAKADEIVKGKYWQDGKGCAIGCTIHSGNHGVYETALGIPQIIARLEDCIFEGLANEVAMTWPLRFLSAIKPGADLSMVWPRFALWLLSDDELGVIRFAKDKKTKAAIDGVVILYREWCDTGIPPAADAADAAYAADAADAAYAAYAADAAYAAYAAYAANAADAADAAYAAYAADAAYAAYAAANAANAANAAYAAYAAKAANAAYAAADAAKAAKAANAANAAYAAARQFQWEAMSKYLLKLLADCNSRTKNEASDH